MTRMTRRENCRGEVSVEQTTADKVLNLEADIGGKASPATEKVIRSGGGGLLSVGLGDTKERNVEEAKKSHERDCAC
ncbi:hypothetical protein WN55_09311 [Dufourea novaeangliae]|uniref:Uncharacterized protein n=1 Tax=Dufourea novaeangliae TaxID=178035 RepID=A0A154P9A0_DUFNO|nr:hypothetical protein WN55_09311 [Dufourea novaeangliae]